MKNHIKCIGCKKDIAVEAFFDNCCYLCPEPPEPNVLTWTCPLCKFTTEIQVGEGGIWFGYVYAAGRAHFAGMEWVRLDELSVKQDGGMIVIEISGISWTILKEKGAQAIKN